jgi:GntR family transcriptional regulator, sialic acid-inducible nan operon repressor
MAAIDPIRRRKLSHEVLDRLLARIRDGEWTEGGHLPSERMLMETFAVGRPVVREALQALERMRLISITHGERARVLPLSAQTVTAQIADIARHLLATSPQTMGQLKEARLFFEVGMVRIAATRATKADVATLRAAVEAQRIAADPEFLQRDMEFHRAIAAISGNAIYVALSQAIFDWLGQFHVNLVRARGAENVTIAEHLKICERIAAHDVEGAAAAMTAHLTRASKLYRRLERSSAEAAPAARTRRRRRP